MSRNVLKFYVFMNSMSQTNIIWLFTCHLRWEGHHRDLSFAEASASLVSSFACAMDWHICHFWSQSVSLSPPHAASMPIHLPGNQSEHKNRLLLLLVAVLSLWLELVSSSSPQARSPTGPLLSKPKVRLLGFQSFISASVFARGETTRPKSNLALHFSWVSTEG